MEPKSSAHYQREYRKRLREQGLVKKEVWVLPKHSKALSSVESQLRTESGLAPNTEADDAQRAHVPIDLVSHAGMSWDAKTLMTALQKQELFQSGSATIEFIDVEQASLYIEMHDFGDLPIFMTISGEQIIVESVLWSIDDVSDLAGFNLAVLKTHKYFPLSTISLESLGDMPDHYHMFGALSSTSLLSNVILEIEMLAANVVQAAETYEEFLSFRR